MLRAGFDPDRPLIATSAFADGSVAAGEAWDWKARGLPIHTALALFQSGLVTHLPPSPPPVSSPELVAAEAVETELTHEQLVDMTGKLDEACGPSTGEPRAIANVDGKPVAIPPPPRNKRRS